MRPYDPPRPRTFALHLALGAAAMLCVQVAVYLLILDDTVGGVALLRRARHASMTQHAEVLVLNSEATAQHLSGEAYGQKLRAWTDALEGMRLPYRVVAEAELAQAPGPATVLVLPGAVCLGDPARDAVRSFLAKGRGVVASGAVGARDGECRWRGFDFLSELTGAERVAAVRLPGAVFAAFRGGEYFEGPMPAGYRLELPHQELVLAVTPRPSVYASDWRLRPAKSELPGTPGLALHTDRGPARVAWLGFDESGAGRRPPAQRTLEAYLGASASWVGRQPIATIATWPGRRPAAAMVVVVTGERKDRLAELAGALRGAGVAATYVARAGGPPVDPAWGGDVATSGDGDEPFATQPLEAQQRRLVDARGRLEATSPGRIAGFLPPAGATDGGTIRAVAAAGLSYTLGEIGGMRATPELIEVPSRLLSILPGRPVVRLFGAAADDQEVLARSEDPVGSFRLDLERVVQLGGLYPLTLHADLAGGAELLPGILSILTEAAGRGVWLATGTEVSRWWVARQGLHAAAKRLSPYRVQVDLNNHGQDHARDVVVSVHLPYAPKRVALRSPVLRLTLPKDELDGEVLRLAFADVAPQSNHTYVISLDE